MSHHKCECQRDNPRFKKLRAESICTLKLKTKKLKAREADIETATMNNADITNLNITNISIQGRDLTCSLQAQPVTYTTRGLQLFGVTGSTGPVVPDNVNPAVFSCLFNNALDYREDLQDRIAKGRDHINQYLAERGCPPTCPPAPTGPVPLELYGTLTLPIYNRLYCGYTGTTGPFGMTGFTGTYYNDFLNTAVNFNLQVTYFLEEAKSIDARNVSVLVQVGYIDPLGPTGGPTGGLLGCTGVTGGKNVVIEEVFVANRQFYPTLDVLYGENFANSISIPSGLLDIAYMNSPLASQGAIMMAIYKEEGLCIWTPKGDGTFECLDSGDNGGNKNSTTGNNSQPAPNPPPSPCEEGLKLCVTPEGLGCVDCSAQGLCNFIGNRC